MYTSPEGNRPQMNDYAPLLEIRATLFPKFEQHQTLAVDAIADLLMQHLHDERVELILDVGCGTGEMLRMIERVLVKRGYTGGLPRMIGIDSCVTAIDQAHAETDTHCQFERFAAEDLVDIESHLALTGVDWDKTFVMSVGHSLPHFEWKAFHKFLGTKRPRFLLIDFYKSWDYAIEQMENTARGEALIEPRHVAKDGSAYLLYTKPADADHVQRGIQKKVAGVSQTLFATRQFAQKAEWFLQQLQASEYLLEKELSYRAGYGEMSGFFLARASTIAHAINDCYYDVVSEVVQETFASRHVLAAMELLRTRVAAVIMPFDRHLPFARYVSIVEGVTNVPDNLMVIADANTAHSRYPTAHGLYMALLDTVSSAAIVPLPNLKGARSTDVDRDFKTNQEDAFFRSSTRLPDLSVRDTQSGARKGDGVYFVVPFYFGDLPLFCLVTNFGSGLPVATTDQSVYISILQNVSRLVQQELHDELIETRILWPFVENSLSWLCREGRYATAEATRRLDGLFADARSLPWKSWLVTIPSTPIRELAVIKKQQDLLKAMWRRCVEKAASDMIVRVSDWFQGAGFFDPEVHSGYNESEHPVRARELKRQANIERFEDLPGAPLLRGNMRTAAPELDWAAAQLRILDESDDESARELAFQSLKAVFCREIANKGTQYRFSLLRLAMLSTMYIPDLQISTIRIHTNVPDQSPAGYVIGDTRLAVNGDRTMELIPLIKCFQASTIERLDFTSSCDHAINVEIRLKEPYEPTYHRGADYSGFASAVERIDPKLTIMKPFTRISLHFRLLKTAEGFQWHVDNGAIAGVVIE